MIRQEIISSIGNVSAETFEPLALRLFQYQWERNEIYRKYAEAIHRNPNEVFTMEQIPFLPISFFKSHTVLSSSEKPVKFFESSSTSGQIPSKHWVVDLKVYERSFLHHFIERYGHPSQYRMLALLPSYLERQHSSLVYMMEYLMKVSGHSDNAFFLHDFEELSKLMAKPCSVPTILVGVTFALLDFTEKFPMPMENTIIMETGGMKGRGKEPIRSEVHQLLTQRTGAVVYSEYGMTELFSQAYSDADEIFHCPAWMRVMIREVDDPLSVSNRGGRGGLNIIDLANVDSCAFIATDDLAEGLSADQFKVLGRLTTAETRGCNLLYV